jgi:hypothetical protein
MFAASTRRTLDGSQRARPACLESRPLGVPAAQGRAG